MISPGIAILAAAIIVLNGWVAEPSFASSPFTDTWYSFNCTVLFATGACTLQLEQNIKTWIRRNEWIMDNANLLLLKFILIFLM
jgi:hypothetical protein